MLFAVPDAAMLFRVRMFGASRRIRAETIIAAEL
jgi:hypothetical protein